MADDMTASEMTGSHIVDLIVIAAAGPIAQARSRIGSAPGWRANRTPRETAAYHEGGHVVARAVIGLPPHRFVSIKRIELPAATISGYATSNPAELTPEQVAELPASSDFKQIVRYIRYLDNDRGERLACWRRLRAATEQLIEGNWGLVRRMAETILCSQSQSLNQAEIAAVLAEGA